MRLHQALGIGFALATAAAAGCRGLSDSREYTLQGQILSVAADHMEASIKHEDIKGFMPGMTMPYKVRDARQFAMRFGVSVSRDTNDPLNITHNLRTAIVDARGAFVKAYQGNEWMPEQVLADLGHVER